MLAAAYFPSPDSQFIINICMAVFAVCLLIYINPFIPLKVRRQMYFSTTSRLELVPPNDPLVPPAALTHLNSTMDVLLALGFEQRGLYKMVDFIPTASLLIAILTHAPSKTVATTLVVILKKNIPNRPHAFAVSFRQLLADGRSVELSNARAQMHLPPRPKCIISYMPSFGDPAALFRTFLRFTEHVAPGVERSTRELIDPRAAEEEDNKDLLQHWASTGHFAFNADRTQLRYTLKGAYLAVWRNVTPLKGFLAWRTEAKERKLVRQLFTQKSPPQ